MTDIWQAVIIFLLLSIAAGFVIAVITENRKGGDDGKTNELD